MLAAGTEIRERGGAGGRKKSRRRSVPRRDTTQTGRREPAEGILFLILILILKPSLSECFVFLFSQGFVRQWVNVRQQLRRLSGDEPELPSAVVNPVPRDLNQRFPLVSDTPGPGRYNSKKSSYYPPPAGAGFLTLAGAPGAGGGEGAYNCVPPTMKAAGVEDGERPFFKDAKSGRSGKEALQCFGSFADRGLGPSASPSKNRVKVGNEGAGNSSCFSGGGKMKSMFKRTPQRQLVRNVSPTAQQELAAGGGGISAQPGGAGRGSERMLMKGGGGGQKQTVVGQLEGAIASKAGGPTGDVVWEKTLAAEGSGRQPIAIEVLFCYMLSSSTSFSHHIMHIMRQERQSRSHGMITIRHARATCSGPAWGGAAYFEGDEGQLSAGASGLR